MEPKIFIAESEDEIERCYEAFKALRPHIEKGSFIAQVLRQRKQSFQIVAVQIGDTIPSAAGFRFAEFLAWGKVLYIDDLTTLADHRGNGYAAMLMDWLIELAKREHCDGLHLDTGHQRHLAHKLYLSKGLEINAHHLSVELNKNA